MFGCICSLTRFLSTNGTAPLLTIQSKLLVLQNSSSLLLRFISVTTQNQGKDNSFTLSYLINSCGLSPASASTVSEHVRFESLTNPNAVIDLLKNHGFSQNQISSMIKKWPGMLLANPENNLLPKLNYMYARGASGADVVRILNICPWIFRRSLERHIIPTFELLRDVLKSDKKVIAAIRRTPKILYTSLQSAVKPNIEILRDNKVPVSSISCLVHYHPTVILLNHSRFNEIVEKAKGYGFDPSKHKFVTAIEAFAGLSNSTWDRKISLFGRLGWSEEITRIAFLKHPWCMMLSEDKITANMDYLVNKFGLAPSYVGQSPTLLSFSLEKRLIPRCSIIQVLKLRGFLNRCCSITTIMCQNDLSFREKFVIPYLDKVPELLDLCQEKIAIAN